MNQQSAHILSGAMQLPPSEREEIASTLWESLELESGMPHSTDSELCSETNQRRTEILRGSVRTISHAELKSQLGR